MKKINTLNIALVLTIGLFSGCSFLKRDEPNKTSENSNVDTTTEKKATNANTSPFPSDDVPANKETAKKEKESEKSGKDTKPDEKTVKTDKLTLENFNKIQTGMSYEEVVKILGTEGKLLNEYEYKNVKTKMYKWDGVIPGENMNAIFQDGKLTTKAQYALK